jgi:hypothetical protein
MILHNHHRRLVATLATGAALAATATGASAMPVDNGRSTASTPVRVVRVQVDEGLDWGDAGIGAAGMLAIVLVGVGALRVAANSDPARRSAAHS